MWTWNCFWNKRYLFLKGHTIWRNLPNLIWHYILSKLKKWDLFTNFCGLLRILKWTFQRNQVCKVLLSIFQDSKKIIFILCMHKSSEWQSLLQTGSGSICSSIGISIWKWTFQTFQEQHNKRNKLLESPGNDQK